MRELQELAIWLGKILLALALVFLVSKDVIQYINYRLDVQIYEIMAKKYDCSFIAPSATTVDIGMFDCHDHIVFKKIEDL